MLNMNFQKRMVFICQGQEYFSASHSMGMAQDIICVFRSLCPVELCQWWTLVHEPWPSMEVPLKIQFSIPESSSISSYYRLWLFTLRRLKSAVRVRPCHTHILNELHVYVIGNDMWPVALFTIFLRIPYVWCFAKTFFAERSFLHISQFTIHDSRCLVCCGAFVYTQYLSHSQHM